MRDDLIFSLRLMRKAPGVSFLAVFCLGLGIGVNTSVFSFLNALLMRPLSVADPDRVIVLARGPSSLFPYPDYLDLRDRNSTLAGLAASIPTESSLDSDGQSHLIAAEAVSENYATVLGLTTHLGQWFRAEEEPVAVLSHSAWRRFYQADPAILGKRIRSEAQSYTVIGIASPSYTGIFAPITVDLWVPRKIWTAQMHNRATSKTMLLGRLKPGVTQGQAQANLRSIDADLVRPEPAPSISVELVHGTPYAGHRRAAIPVMTLLMAITGLVLVIACVNVGNLLLARGAARRREISIRLALGAGRRRILAQLFNESLILSLLGALSGLLLAAWTNRLIEGLLPELPMGESLRPSLDFDWRVLSFAAAVAFSATILSSLSPAWRSSRTDVAGELRGQTGGGARLLAQRIWLVVQVAISMLLLLSAGLFLRSWLSLRQADPGFSVSHRLYARTYVSPPEFTPLAGRQFYLSAVEALRRLPGVRSAAVTGMLPLMMPGSDCVKAGDADPVRVSTSAIGEGYFLTLGISLTHGREFLSSDTTAPVVIVSETLAGRLWPKQNPVGQRIRLGCDTTLTAEVVGLSRDSKTRSLLEDSQPHLYKPFAQAYTGLAHLVMETSAPANSIAPSVRQALLNVHPGVRIYSVDTLESHLAQSYWQVRWEASLITIFGLLALVLAAVGLYGVMAFHVSRRFREIGIRIALGAVPTGIYRLILQQGLQITLLGILIGAALSLTASRILARFLPGTDPLDPVTYLSVAAIWTFVSLFAGYVPARRAARIQPMAALRLE